MAWTRDQVIVDHTCSLHQRVADRRTDKFESALQQVAAHRVGLGCARGYVEHAPPAILNWLAANEAPEIKVERSEFLLHSEKALRVCDCRCDFQSVPHDSIIA